MGAGTVWACPRGAMARRTACATVCGTGAALALAWLCARQRSRSRAEGSSSAGAGGGAGGGDCGSVGGGGGYDTGLEVEGEAPRRLRKAETVLRRRTSRLIVVLESSYDQHNQSAVLRTADCLGIQHCWLVDPVEEKGVHPQAQGKRYPTKKAQEKAEKRAAQEAAMRAQLAAGTDGGSGATAAADAALGERARISRRIAKQSAEWLSVRHFSDTTSCLAALRAEGYTIWVTHLGQAAVPLTDSRLKAPLSQDDASPGVRDGVGGGKLAVVFGREADGVSEEMAKAADELVYFPMDGYCESLNLSVSAALVLQHIITSFPALKYRRRSSDRDGSVLDTLEGAMSDEERESLRRDWFLRLAKTPAQVEEYPRWASGELPAPKPFDDLRRTEELRKANNMIPPKIRKRLAALEAR